MVTKATTPEAKKVWNSVKKAAEGVPEWVKPVVTKRANEIIRRIRNVR